MPNPATSLERYCQFFTSLTRESLDKMPDLVAEDVHFIDPFNNVHGLDGMQKVLVHMFDGTEKAVFTVHDAVLSNQQGYIHWHFHYQTRRGHGGGIDGLSIVKVNDDGKIMYHKDYWDASSEVYEKWPLLGPLLRFVKRRLKA